MKKLTCICITVLMGSTYAMAQNLDSVNRIQRRSMIRPIGAGTPVLKTPGAPAVRDYTKPSVSTSLNSGSVNPSLIFSRVETNRSASFSSTGFSLPVTNQGQVSTPRLRVGITPPVGGLPTPSGSNAIAIPAAAVPGNVIPGVSIPGVVLPLQPVTTPSLPTIINPVLPIVTPVIKPVLPIVAPVLPIIKPVLPIVVPSLPPIKLGG